MTTSTDRLSDATGEPVPIDRPQSQSSSIWVNVQSWFSVWWFILPALVFYLVATLLPALQGTAEGFTDWDGLSADIRWVGFGNFVTMYNDPAVVAAILHTLIIVTSLTIIQNVLGLLLALGVNSQIKTARI